MAQKRDKMAIAEATASKSESKENTVTTATTNSNATAPKTDNVVTAITKTWDELIGEGIGIVAVLPKAQEFDAVEFTPFRRLQRKDGSGSFIASKVKVVGMGFSYALDFYFNEETSEIREARQKYTDKATKTEKWGVDIVGQNTGLRGADYGRWVAQMTQLLTGLFFAMNKQTLEDIEAL